MIVRHKLLADLVRLWKNDQLIEKIDRLPVELSPRRSKPMGRCCIHKERAVWRYKTFPLMGLDMTDEHDEVAPLSDYARMALSRPEPNKENIMCVIDEACSSCVQIMTLASAAVSAIRVVLIMPLCISPCHVRSLVR